MGSVTNQANAFASGNRDHKHKRSTAHMVIGAAIALTDESADVLVIDQGGTTRVVTLPAASNANEGREYWIKAQNAANNLTLNIPEATTIATITPLEWCHVINVKGTWHAHSTAPS